MDASASVRAARGRKGHEALDREQRSLGLFKTAAVAANVVFQCGCKPGRHPYDQDRPIAARPRAPRWKRCSTAQARRRDLPRSYQPIEPEPGNENAGPHWRANPAEKISI
jgi:hypothetical protein